MRDTNWWYWIFLVPTFLIPAVILLMDDGNFSRKAKHGHPCPAALFIGNNGVATLYFG